MGKRQVKRLAAYNAKLEVDKIERERLQGRKRDKERLLKEQLKVTMALLLACESPRQDCAAVILPRTVCPASS
jgi:hypothetical protein